MKQFTTVLLLLLACAARGQEAEPEPADDSYKLLGRTLDRKISEFDWGAGTVRMAVYDLDNGIGIYEREADLGSAPGSLMKLFTAAAALDILGPEFTFKTQLEWLGHTSGRTFDGDLIVVGDGDPTLGMDAGDAGFALFDKWSDLLHAKGIKAINGGIQLDTTAFDALRRPVGWPSDMNGDASMPDVSALNFHQNCFTFSWKAAGKPGKTAAYTIWPQVKDYLLVSNNVRTSKAANQPRLYRRTGDARVINASGELPLNTAVSEMASAPGAPVFFGETFKSRLINKKIKVEGQVREIVPDLKPGYTKEPAPEGRKPELLDTHVSEQLFKIVQRMLTEDQTLPAEVILKTLARGGALGRLGTTVGGAEAVARNMRERRVPPTGLVMLDGSGQSTLNRVTPLQVMALLRVLRREHPYRKVLTDCFARPGQPGLMAGRFAPPKPLTRDAAPDAAKQVAGATNSKAKGKGKTDEKKATPSPTPTPAPADAHDEPHGEVWAIPGHLRGGASLAGWATTATGQTFHFVIIVNGTKLGAPELDEMIDAIVRQITLAQI